MTLRTALFLAALFVGLALLGMWLVAAIAELSSLVPFMVVK